MKAVKPITRRTSSRRGKEASVDSPVKAKGRNKPSPARPASVENLRTAARQALAFVLNDLHREGGALIVQTREDQEPVLAVSQNPPATWDIFLASFAGVLRAAIQKVWDEGDAPVADPGLELAAAICLPAQTRMMGVLLVAGEPLSGMELRRLKDLASVAGRTLLLAYSGQTLPETDKELAVLHMIAAILTSNLDLDEIQKTILAGIRQILDCEVGCLALTDREAGTVSRKALGDAPDWILQSVQQMQGDIVEQCLSSFRPVLVDEPDANPELRESLDRSLGLRLRSYVCAPLIADGNPVGAVEMINKRIGTFTDHDEELLNLLATSIAGAIYNRRLILQLREVNIDLKTNRSELLNSRNTLRALFDTIPSSIYIIDRAYALRAVNLSRAGRARAKPNQLVGRCCYEALFGRIDPCPGCRVAETLQAGETTQRAQRRKESSGEELEWEISTYPIRDETGIIHQAILLEEDITERRQLEASLAQSEKLAAVGQLAAGVAHEINNPLTAVIANAQLLQRSLPPESELQESVELIVIAGGRAAQVVRNLLDFARKEQYRFDRVDINETIRKALGLIQHEVISRGINLTFSPEDRLPRVLASGDHLQGVWLNLLLNAVDSFEGVPGEILVRTLQQDDHVRVSVHDNGKGIPEEYLARIFEPFFTTKSPGRGTGLGLSVCHQIIKQHNGEILVQSKAGEGTTFTVVLPIHDQTPSQT